MEVIRSQRTVFPQQGGFAVDTRQAVGYVALHVFRLPEIQVGENERITQAEVTFQAALIRSIRNIPPGWDVDIDLANPPNPVLKGSIIVGAAAVGSMAELPEFELENYTKDFEPRPERVVFMVAEYSGDMGKERRVVVQLGKP